MLPGLQGLQHVTTQRVSLSQDVFAQGFALLNVKYGSSSSLVHLWNLEISSQKHMFSISFAYLSNSVCNCVCVLFFVSLSDSLFISPDVRHGFCQHTRRPPESWTHLTKWLWLDLQAPLGRPPPMAPWAKWMQKLMSANPSSNMHLRTRRALSSLPTLLRASIGLQCFAATITFTCSEEW